MVFVTLRDAQRLQFAVEPAAARRDAARSPGAAASSDTVNAVLVRLLPDVDAKQFVQAISRWKHVSALTHEDQETVLSRSVIERARRQIGLFTSLLLIVSTVIIGLIISSAFPAIIVYAQELLPKKLGMISGLFYGFAFGMGALGSALLGVLADQTSVSFVYQLCSFLPIFGGICYFLPNLKR